MSLRGRPLWLPRNPRLRGSESGVTPKCTASLSQRPTFPWAGAPNLTDPSGQHPVAARDPGRTARGEGCGPDGGEPWSMWSPLLTGRSPRGPCGFNLCLGFAPVFLQRGRAQCPSLARLEELRAHRVYFWQVVLMTDGTQFPFNKVGDRKSQVKSRSLREAAVWVVRSGRGRMWNDRIWENNPKTPLWKWGWVGCPGSWDQKSDLELGPPPLGFLSVGLSKNSPPPRAVSTWK